MKARLQLSVTPRIKRLALACARRRGKSISVLVEEHIQELDSIDWHARRAAKSKPTQK